METKQFKTNAKCNGCLMKIAAVLNKRVHPDQWSMDMLKPEKVLVITSDLPDGEIIGMVEEAGFRAERI